MQVIYKLLKELKHYERNNKIHDVSNIEDIAKSIDEFGFTMPILIDSNNVIVAGHGRHLAAEHLGYEKVPCIILEDLDEEQIKAYRVADNKLAELSKWDFDNLEAELRELKELNFDLELLGFDEKELEKLLKEEIENFEPGTEEEQGQLDKIEPKWVVCPHCGEKFDEREA